MYIYIHTYTIMQQHYVGHMPGRYVCKELWRCSICMCVCVYVYIYIYMCLCIFCNILLVRAYIHKCSHFLDRSVLAMLSYIHIHTPLHAYIHNNWVYLRSFSTLRNLVCSGLQHLWITGRKELWRCSRYFTSIHVYVRMYIHRLNLVSLGLRHL